MTKRTESQIVCLTEGCAKWEFLPIHCRFANKSSKSLIGRKFEGLEGSPDFLNTLATKEFQVRKQEAIIVDFFPLNKHNFNHDLTNVFIKIFTGIDMQIPNLVIPNCMDISLLPTISLRFSPYHQKIQEFLWGYIEWNLGWLLRIGCLFFISIH